MITNISTYNIILIWLECYGTFFIIFCLFGLFIKILFRIDAFLSRLSSIWKISEFFIPFKTMYRDQYTGHHRRKPTAGLAYAYWPWILPFNFSCFRNNSWIFMTIIPPMKSPLAKAKLFSFWRCESQINVMMATHTDTQCKFCYFCTSKIGIKGYRSLFSTHSKDFYSDVYELLATWH